MSTNPGPSSRPGLLRTASRASSIHAQTSLRRMLTHETGTGAERMKDTGRVAHDPHHEHEDEDASDRSDEHHAQLHVLPPNTERPVSDGGSASKEDIGEGEGSVEKTADAEAQEEGQPGRRKKLELQDQTNLLPARQVIVVFAGLSMALFCSLLDQTIVVTALPTLGQAFGRADIVSWVGTSYLLTSTAMQPLYGRLSDIFGRKGSLLSACVIFFLGSLGCSVSANMIQLICFRAIQGVGGGGILTLSMIIVSDIVTLKERGKYQGIIGMVIATANSIGPLIGGLLTEKATWRWSFWISLPLTAAAFLVILFLLPLKSVRGDTMTKLRAIDWAGSILTLAWAVLFLIGLSWAGTQYSWSSPAVLVPIILGLALLGLFLWVETHVALPVIPLYIFKSPTVSASMASTFFSGLAFFCTLYYLPTYLQIVHGASPIRSGILTLPLAATQTITAFIAGYVTSRTGDYYYSLVSGFAIWTVGIGLLTTLSTTTSEAMFVGYQIVVAIGAGQTFQTSLLAIQAAVERKDMAAATGTRNFMRMLGGTVGLAACGSIVNNLVRSDLSRAGVSESLVQRILKDPTPKGGWTGELDINIVKQSYAHGIRGVFYLLLPLTAISCFIVLIFVKKISLKRDDDAKRKEEGKEWLESRRNKKGKKGPVDAGVVEQGRHGDGETEAASAGLGEKIKEEVKKEERALGAAAEVMDEAAGVTPISHGGEVDRRM